MTQGSKISIAALCVFFFSFGIFIDRLIKDFPYLRLEPKVGVLDILSLIVTIIIAVLIPFSVSKIIEDKRGIKVLLVEEFRELIAIIASVKQIITDSHSTGIFEDKDRNHINSNFHEAELKTGSIREQLQEAFGSKSNEVVTSSIDLLFQYEDYVTGGDLMRATFTTVNDHFFRENNTEYSKIETGLKKLIQKVHKF